MGEQSAIEWTEATWNPLVGCSRVSEGCRFCYAEREAHRLGANNPKYTGLTLLKGAPFRPHWTGEVRLWEPHLAQPLRWTNPRRVFVNSMSDLFHEKVPDEWIDQIFAVMTWARQHTFQILTKRPQRMLDYCAGMAALPPSARGFRIVTSMYKNHPAEGLIPKTQPASGGEFPWPLDNVWLGVSVEDQATADERIPVLLQTLAAVRWVSYEPALEMVAFRWWLHDKEHRPEFIEPERNSRIDWLVVGGESGPGARPFDLGWARSAIAHCRAAGVPVFVKQLGAQPIGLCTPGCSLGPHSMTFRDRKGGDPSEWPKDLGVREYPSKAS